MRYGIDFGTTRTVVAAVDRGNYPVVSSTDLAGDFFDFIPSVVALDGDELIAGWQANQADHVPVVRSFKRLLAGKNVTAEVPVHFGQESRPLGEVMEAFARHVVDTLREHQRSLGDDSPVQAVLGVPANASSSQRLLTLHAFSSAGAEVLGLINEPSAAAFEYTHRHALTLNSRRKSIIVYDLGGGTFDATLLRIDGRHHDVITSRGVSRLGGDDFDEVLLNLALAEAGRSGDVFGARVRRRLLDEARSAKEQLKPQSRRIVLELEDADVVVAVEDFYAAVTALVERTLDVLTPLVGHEDGLTDTDIAGIYLVGGASSLPLVSRVLRTRFGRRVHRSQLPTASTAVGLAIAADPDSGYLLSDRRARGIGVFRESDGGATVTFDPLLAPGETHAVRRYRAAHNVGVFRFVEYSEIDDAGNPGDLSVLAEVVVPFERALRGRADLAEVPVARTEDGPEVVETVTVDDDGIAVARIELPGEDFCLETRVGATVARGM